MDEIILRDTPDRCRPLAGEIVPPLLALLRERRALEEIAARKRGREVEHGVVILDRDNDEDAAGPSNPPRQPGEGCGRDGGRGGGDDDDGCGDYTRFYSLLGM